MPVTVRDAATVILVRDASDGDGEPAIEVCMLRRNLASEFVAGVYVFPGGAVDPDDYGDDIEALCPGRTDAEASTLLGIDSGGLAFWVAALRECFEEAGVLLAFRPADQDGDADQVGGKVRLLDTTDPASLARFVAYRDALNAGTTRLLDVCRSEGLALDVGSVHYVSHWITPELAPRRYDTRFFITTAPSGQVARHDDGETIASIWIRPGEALSRFHDGEIELLPPTIENLRTIGRFQTTEEAMTWAEQVTDIPEVLPIVLIEDGQVLILRPGDEGYEEAAEAKMAAGPDAEARLAAATREVLGPKADQI
jgi:8-oxo-dGTP pyrophosphatase MutT (NUDIX family)